MCPLCVVQSRFADFFVFGRLLEGLLVFSTFPNNLQPCLTRFCCFARFFGPSINHHIARQLVALIHGCQRRLHTRTTLQVPRATSRLLPVDRQGPFRALLRAVKISGLNHKSIWIVDRNATPGDTRRAPATAADCLPITSKPWRHLLWWMVDLRPTMIHCTRWPLAVTATFATQIGRCPCFAIR